MLDQLSSNNPMSFTLLIQIHLNTINNITSNNVTSNGVNFNNTTSSNLTFDIRFDIDEIINLIRQVFSRHTMKLFFDNIIMGFCLVATLHDKKFFLRYSLPHNFNKIYRLYILLLSIRIELLFIH